MNKCHFLLILILGVIFSSNAMADCTISVTDQKNNPVKFSLKSETKVFVSGNDGKLKLTNGECDSYREEVFKFVFVDRLASLIYEPRLMLDSNKAVPTAGQDGSYILQYFCDHGQNQYTVPNLKRGLKK